MSSLPTGTVTFLFTDIEKSTALLQRLGDRQYAEILEEHQRLLREAFAEGNGREIDTQGDAFLVAFSRARDALGTAVAVQRSLMKHNWPDGVSLQVRIGLHTGEPIVSAGRYVGLDVHRAARICAAAHGGQILLSDRASALVTKDLPDTVTLRDLGEHRLKDLAHPHRLLQALAPGLSSDFPPLRTLDAHAHNLPIQLTSFIGRAREIAEVKRVLSAARLVTLTGSGGAGKTRLALQVTADVVEDYPEGVWLAEFAPIADPGLVPKTVASAMNVPEQPGRDMTGTLIDTLRPKALLLVLDNCEHLLAACRDLAAALLRTCPHLRILATSREGLGVPGETLWRVPSLSMPEDVRHLRPSEELVLYDAVRLFFDRAVASTPGFTVTAENAPAVVEVCRRLDGIPLAIELAAARTKVLSVEQIAVRLDDRFRLLTGGSRTLLPRQQTLRATLDWSYALLSDRERTVLRRLSVFAGGWTLVAAEAVCAGGAIEASDILDLLTQLVDKSLVVAETQRGEARYRLLETVRQYSRDRVLEGGNDEDVRERHANFFLAVAEEAEPRLGAVRAPDITSIEDLRWMERLEREHDNFRAALEWSRTSSQNDTTLRLANALGPFWEIRGYWSEGRQRLEQALLRASTVSPTLRASALYRAGCMTWGQRDIRQAVAKLEESLALFRGLGDKDGMTASLNRLAIVAYRQGEYERATTLLEESLSLSRESHYKVGIASSLHYLGVCARLQGNYEQAEALDQESLSLFRALGLKRWTAFALDSLGLLAFYRGNFDRANALCGEALGQFQQWGDKFGAIGSLNSLGVVACVQGDYKRAAALCQESLVLSRELGDMGAMARSLNVLGRVAHFQGDCKQAEKLYKESLTLFWELGEKLGVAQCLERLGSAAITSAPERAVRLFAAADSLREAIGSPLPPSDRPDYDRNLAAVGAHLNQTAVSAVWVEGRAMTLEQAIEYALTSADNSL